MCPYFLLNFLLFWFVSLFIYFLIYLFLSSFISLFPFFIFISLFCISHYLFLLFIISLFILSLHIRLFIYFVIYLFIFFLYYVIMYYYLYILFTYLSVINLITLNMPAAWQVLLNYINKHQLIIPCIKSVTISRLACDLMLLLLLVLPCLANTLHAH